MHATSFDRRQFLQGTAGLSAAAFVVTLGGACSHTVPVLPEGLQALGAQHAETFRALAETVLAGLPHTGAEDIAGIVRAVDAALATEHEILRAKVQDALLFLEWTPQFSLKFKAFSLLNVGDRTVVLQRFAQSPLKIKRTVYQGLTAMTLFAYADREVTWDQIGYSGPWVGMPNAAGSP